MFPLLQLMSLDNDGVSENLGGQFKYCSLQELSRFVYFSC